MRDKKYVVFGFLLLFLGSYIDTARGPLIPVLAEHFGLDYASTSWFLISGNLGSILAILLMLPLTHWFMEKWVAVGVIVFSLISLFFAFTATGFASLVFFSVLLGSSISLMGAVSNLFVIRGSSESKLPRLFCGLHMMYGIASLIAPFCVNYILDRKLPWYSPLFLFFPILLILPVIIGFQFKVKENETHIVKQKWGLNKGQFLLLFSFAAYVGGEVMLSMWLVTYLVEAMHLSFKESAFYLSLFFMLMSGTRALCFLSLSEKAEKKVMIGCMVMAVFFFNIGYFGGYLWAFVLAGFVGPFFPLFLGFCNRSYPLQGRTFTLWVLTSSQVTLALCHFVLGRLTRWIGVEKAYFTPSLLLIISLLVFLLYLKKSAKQGFTSFN